MSLLAHCLKNLLNEEQLLPVKMYGLCKSIQNSKFTMVKLYKCSLLLDLKFYNFQYTFEHIVYFIFYCFLHPCHVIVIFLMPPICKINSAAASNRINHKGSTMLHLNLIFHDSAHYSSFQLLCVKSGFQYVVCLFVFTQMSFPSLP